MIRFQSKRRLLLLFVLGLLLFSAWGRSLPAKEKKKEAEKHPSSTFQVNVNLVSVNVNVTDKRGVPIPDLTEKDFQILDNGVPQKISVFRVETIPGSEVSAPNAGANSPTLPAPPTTSRKVILFVDDYDTDFASLVYVRKAGEQFIRTGLGPTDLVALITASGRHSTEFSMDRQFIIDNLNQVFPVTPESKGREACPPIDQYQAIMIQEGIWSRDKREMVTQIPQFEELIAATAACACPQCSDDVIMELIKAAANRLAFQSLDWSRRVLYSLQALNRRLSAIKGPKELVLLSPGFMLGAPIIGELQYELSRTIDSAIRANTVIDSVNVAGLVPDISASSPTPEMNRSESRSALEDSLRALATETGGKLYHNNNDLFALMKESVSKSIISYVLGFYSPDERRDGQFHKLTVKVDRPGVSISARKGYYTTKGDEDLNAMNSETIRNVLDNSQELKDVPVSLSLNITNRGTPEALAEVQTRIDVKKIHFRKGEKRNQDTFTIVTIVYDSNNQFVDGREAHLDLNLTDPHYQDVLKTGLAWKAQFKLPSGHYMAKTAVLEAGEGKLGSAFKALEIGE